MPEEINGKPIYSLSNLDIEDERKKATVKGEAERREALEDALKRREFDKASLGGIIFKGGISYIKRLIC